MIYLINKINNKRIQITDITINACIKVSYMQNYTLDLTISNENNIYKLLNNNYYIETNTYNNCIDNFDIDNISLDDNNDINIQCTHLILKKLDKNSVDNDIFYLNSNCINNLFNEMNIEYECCLLSNPINDRIINCLEKSKFEIFKEIINNYQLEYYILNNKIYIINANDNQLNDTITKDDIVAYEINRDYTNYYNYVTFYTADKNMKVVKDFRKNKDDIIYKKNEITDIKKEDVTSTDDLLNKALYEYYYNVKNTDRYDYMDNSIDLQCIKEKEIKMGYKYLIELDEINEKLQILEIEFNVLMNFVENIKMGKKEKDIVELLKDDDNDKNDIDNKIDEIKDDIKNNIKDDIKNDIKNDIADNNNNIIDSINRKFFITGNIRARNGESNKVINLIDPVFEISSNTTCIPIISSIKCDANYSIGGYNLYVQPSINEIIVSLKMKILDENGYIINDNNAHCDFKVLFIDEVKNINSSNNTQLTKE